LLAMVVNDYALFLATRVVLEFFASKLAPTGKNDNAVLQIYRSARFAALLTAPDLLRVRRFGEERRHRYANLLNLPHCTLVAGDAGAPAVAK
jgi:hypothetical protein